MQTYIEMVQSRIPICKNGTIRVYPQNRLLISHCDDTWQLETVSQALRCMWDLNVQMNFPFFALFS